MLVEVSVVEQRYQAVLGVIKSGRSVVEVASARPRRWCWSGVGSIRGGSPAAAARAGAGAGGAVAVSVRGVWAADPVWVDRPGGPAAEPMELWQLDVVGGIGLANGTEVSGVDRAG
jgi:hypothetical protein